MKTAAASDRHWVRDHAALLSLALVTAALFASRFLLGEDAPIRVHDTFDSEFPRFAVGGSFLKNFEVNEWYSQFAGGMPFLAHHFGQFDVFVLVSAFLPPWLVYQGTVALWFLAAVVGIYAFSREFMEATPRASIFAALLFGFSIIQQVVFSSFEFLFPLIFVILHGRLCKSLAGNAVLAAVLALLSLASYPILTNITFAALHFGLLVYLLIRGRLSKTDILVFFIYWAALSVEFIPNALALLEYISQSHREYPVSPFSGGLEAALYLVQEFWSKFVHRAVDSGYWPILAMSFVLAVWSVPVRGMLALYVIFTVLSAMFATDFYALFSDTFFAYFDLGHIKRATSVILGFLGAAILASFYLRTWRQTRLALLVGLISLAMMPVLNRIGLPAGTLTDMVRAATVLCACLGVVAVRMRPGILKEFAWPTACVALMAVALFGYVRLDVREKETYRDAMGPDAAIRAFAEAGQTTDFRVLQIGWPSVRFQIHGIETLGGRGPLFSRDYRLLAEVGYDTAAVEEQRLQQFRQYWYLLELIDLMDSRFDVDNLYLPGLALLNVCYIITKAPIHGLDPLTPSDVAGHPIPGSWEGIIYRVPGCGGRASLASNARFGTSEEDALRQMQTAPPEELSNMVWLTGKPSTSTRDIEEKCGSVVTRKSASDRFEFLVQNRHPCWLVFKTNYHKRWSAKVDGAEAKIVPANIAFMAVKVDSPGEHLVSFDYRPMFGIWLALFPIGFLVFVAAIFFIRLRSATEPAVQTVE